MTTTIVTTPPPVSNLVISNGDQVEVFNGGTIIDTTVSSGGLEKVFAGGIASGTIVSDGGYEYVYLGATASGTIVSSGGYDYVSGTASGIVVSTGGYAYVSGTASGTVVAGGEEYVRSDGLASGTVVRSGYEYVCSDGTASGTVVSGGEEYVSGVAADTTVSNGGTEVVYAGGTASGVTVENGGTLIVSAGGSAVDVTVDAGGTVVGFSAGVSAGQTVSGISLQSGATETVSSGGTASGMIVSSGGTEVVAAGGTAAGIVISAGGTAVLDSGALTTGGIVLTGGGAELEIDGTVMPTATISGFLGDATIDLANEAYASGAQATLEPGNILQITGIGTGTLDLQLDPGQNYTNTSFVLASDGGGGTDIMSDSTFTWVGGFGGSYSTAVPQNWSPNGQPQPGDTVLVPADSTLDVPSGGTLSDLTIDVTGPSVITWTEVTASGNTVDVGSGTVWYITGTPTIVTGNTIDNGSSVVTNSTITGDTYTFDPNATLSLTDTTVNQSSITFATGDTLDLTGTMAGSMVIDPNSNGNSQSQFQQTGSDATVVINTAGTVTNNGFMWVDSPGGTTTLNVANDGSIAGMYDSEGPILVNSATLVVNSATNVVNGSTLVGDFANAGFLLDYGGTQASLVQINAQMDSRGGQMDILGGAHGATLELNTKVGGGQYIEFGDGNGTLVVESASSLLANTKAHIVAFQPGDIIELAGLKMTGSNVLTYSYGNDSTYGPDVLELKENATLIGVLRFSGTQFADSTGTLNSSGIYSGSTGSFVLSSDSNNTYVTLAATAATDVATWVGAVGDTSGGGDWSSAAMWGGALPGQYQTAQFALTADEADAIAGGNFPSYVVTVNSAEKAGSVVFADPLATLEIGAALTLGTQAGQSGGGSFQQTNGTVDIFIGGTLSATNYNQVGDTLLIGSGGSLVLSGTVAFSQGLGLLGLDVENDATISGGTVASAGATLIGEKSPGSITAETSGGVSGLGGPAFGVTASTITDNYTMVGGATFGDPSGDQSSLTISGLNTKWTDAGTDPTTNYAGAMLVGGGFTSVSGTLSNGNYVTTVPGGGDGQLLVDQGATLTEALYAALGLTQTSEGQATVSNGAVWDIDPTGATRPDGIVVGNSTIYNVHTVSIPALMVGLGGSGSLNIQSGGTVQLGPVTTPVTTFVMAVGEGGPSNPSATGQVDVDGVGSLLNTGGGPLVIGLYGSGQVNVSNGGTAVVANGGTNSSIGFGAILGDNNAGTVDSRGMLQVSGNGTAESLFSVTAGNLVIGDNGYGFAEINSFGSLSVAAGDILLGGAGVGNAGTSGASGTLDVFGGQVAAAGLWVVSNPTVTQGSSIDISNNGTVSLTSAGGPADVFDLVSGNANINGGGLLSFDNLGTAEIGNATLDISNNGTMAFAGYTGTSYQLIVGDGTNSGAASTVMVAGSGANLTVHGPIDIGQTGTGTLIVGSNGTVNDGSVGGGLPWSAVLGNNAQGTLVVGGSGDVGAQFNATALAVGLNSFGLLHVGQGGTVSVSKELDVGGSPLAGTLYAANGTGQVTIDGGGGIGDALVSVAGSIVVGNTTGLTGNSSITVADGGSLSATGTLYLGDTPQGTGSDESGSLTLTNNAQAQFGGLALWKSSGFSMDSSSELILGSTGIPAGAPGDILIGSDGVLSGGGTIGTMGTIVDNGLIEATVTGNVNLLHVVGPISGSGTLDIAAGATLEVGIVASTDTVEFGAGSLNTMVLTIGALPFSMQASIEHFYAGNTIDLTNQVQSSVTLSWDQEFTNSGVLSVTNGPTLIADLNFAGNYAQGSFTTQSDNFGGTDIVNSTAPCFAAGTRLATLRGAVAVEDLRLGDQVRLARGGTAPVLWLGHRSVDCARHPRPRDVMPVRVAAHAFGFGQPSGDLRLSPDHAVFVDGVLIPVRYLLNGATVMQETASLVTYWHVELDHHDVLLAEGLACESYLDTGNRGAFANGGGATMMHADFALKVWERESCARLVLEGAELEAARSYLLDRAHGLGFAMTGDADLHLIVNGEPLEPTTVAGGVHRFILPADAAAVVIASRSAIPGEMADVYADGRRLGVMLERITFRQHGEPCEVALDGLPDGAGFHGVERDGDRCWRWTDGQARLEVPAGFAPDAPLALELHVVASQPAWIVTTGQDRGQAVSAAA